MKVEDGNPEFPPDPVVGEEGKYRFADEALVFRVFLSSVFPRL